MIFSVQAADPASQYKTLLSRALNSGTSVAEDKVVGADIKVVGTDSKVVGEGVGASDHDSGVCFINSSCLFGHLVVD